MNLFNRNGIVVNQAISSTIRSAKEYLTRETISNLARFWADLSEDINRTYDALSVETPPLMAGKTKEPDAEREWEKGIEEHDRFTTEFTPPVPRLWKEFSPQLEKLRSSVESQMEIYHVIIEGDESQPALQKLDALKTQTNNLFNALWQELRK